MASALQLKTPVGRIVAGSLYKPNEKDFDGQPLKVKTGPNIGQPRVQYFIAVAVPKKPGETHWAFTEWGKEIWAAGHAAFPQAAQTPTFAWKIEDGDSTVPNKRNKRPCDQEGYPGNWIIRASGGFAPKIFRQEGQGFVEVTEPDWVKPGYYVEVEISVDGNKNQNNPGMYINLGRVCFRAYGPEITFGPSIDEIGFGAEPLPAGASATPPASAVPLPGAATPPAAPQTPLPPATAAAPLPVTPNPGFLQIPPPTGAPNPATPAVPGAPGASPSSIPAIPGAVAAPPPVAAAPAAPTGPTMTAAAGGVTYQAYKTAGWSDEQLIANGLMVQ